MRRHSAHNPASTSRALSIRLHRKCFAASIMLSLSLSPRSHRDASKSPRDAVFPNSHSFDKNKDGFIDAGELRELLSRGGNTDTKGSAMSEGDVQAMISSFDDNGDGKLSIEEVRAALERDPILGSAVLFVCVCLMR